MSMSETTIANRTAVGLDGMCYLILTTPRTGSYLLCDLLRQSGVAGRPDEYFGDLHQARITGGLAVSAKNYLEELRQISWEKFGGIFGAKVMWRQLRAYVLPALRDLPDMTDQAVLKAAFPNLMAIHLRRRDTARQALSYARAVQDEKWLQTATNTSACRGPTAQDMELALQLEMVIKADVAATHTFLQHCDVPVLELTYEYLAQDVTHTLNTCLTFLGLRQLSRSTIEPRLIKQSTSSDDAWLDRYLTFKKGRLA